MEPKKISFGFSKTNKKANLLPLKESEKPATKVELIKCLEGQEIKLVNEQPEEKPLTIPLKNSQKTSTALASLLKRRAVLLGEEEPDDKDVTAIDTAISPNNNETEDIEKRAARELLSEVQKNIYADQTSNLVLPVVKADDLPLEGATESTLDDYESIPIHDFGKAMLRGMGWTDPLPKPNKKVGLPNDDTPMVRPKGMGLGADKSLNKKPLLVAPEPNEVLDIKRNAFVRILGGKYKDLYGQVEGFDDYAGRVIVKLAIGGSKEAFNEFLCQPVSRKEYAQCAKCINSSKYDEYKKKENEHGQINSDKNNKDRVLKNEKKCSTNDKYERDHKNVDRYKHSKEEKYIKQEKESIGKKEENRNRIDNEYEIKNRHKEEGTCRVGSRNRTDDDRYHERKYDRSPERGNHRADEKYYRREDDRNNTIKLRKDIKEDKHRNSRSCEMSTNREKQTKYDSHQYKAYDNSSDSEREFNTSKGKKKSKKLHSKKSKKRKSKYKDTSSDTESTPYSTDSSSDSEQERTKKCKKKKKSKKQRERSRLRERR